MRKLKTRDFKLDLCILMPGRSSVEIPGKTKIGSVDAYIYRAVNAFAFTSLMTLCLTIRCPPKGLGFHQCLYMMVISGWALQSLHLSSIIAV